VNPTGSVGGHCRCSLCVFQGEGAYVEGARLSGVLRPAAALRFGPGPPQGWFTTTYTTFPAWK
jgi:hypothetical protein